MDNDNCKPYLISIKNLIFILLCAFYSYTRFKFVLFAAVVAERAARFFLSAIFDFRSKGAPRGSFSCSEVFGRQTDLACFLTEYRVRRPVDLLARSPFFVSASVLRFPLGLWLRAQYFRSGFFFARALLSKSGFRSAGPLLGLFARSCLRLSAARAFLLLVFPPGRGESSRLDFGSRSPFFDPSSCRQISFCGRAHSFPATGFLRRQRLLRCATVKSDFVPEPLC
jgi:hypothetical protein